MINKREMPQRVSENSAEFDFRIFEALLSKYDVSVTCLLVNLVSPMLMSIFIYHGNRLVIQA